MTVNASSMWNKFWNPPGTAIGLFFVKFILFTILGFFAWTLINNPYNAFLRTATVYMIEDSLPLLETNSSPERGTFDLLFAPYISGPMKLENPKNVPISLLLNTLHFNIIPFIGLLFASPFVSWRRFLAFLGLGIVFLLCTHLLHIYLNLNAYYFKIQKFSFEPHSLSPEQLLTIQKWRYFRNMVNLLQAFMEQAGSMIAPALVWLIYASKWIFRSFSVNKAKAPLPNP